MTLITCPRCSRQVAGGKFCPGCGARIDDPLAGKVLAGKWKLVAQTAKGVYFSTYRAEPKTGGVPVSVKVLDAALGESDDRRRRFLENAGAALSLTDRRLLAIREMAEEPLDRTDGKVRGAVYAVADAPGGPSLSDIVAKQGALSPARALGCIKGLLEALATVHAAGLVHGDLHPACVFLEPDGSGREQVRVADAGLAQGLGGGGGGEGADPAALGSDGGRWLSPEQSQGQEPGAPSDIHAAGALLYFALTGIPPWQSEKGQPLLFEIQRSFPRAATEVKLEIPESMDGVIDRALAKAPGERYRSAAEFARVLGKEAAGLTAGASPAVPDDITPGAMTLGAIPAAYADDSTMTAMPPRPAPRAPAGDETFVGRAEPVRPPAAPPAAAPTAALPRTPAPKPAPPPAAKPAAKAPPPAAKAAAKPAAARKAPPPPAEPNEDDTLLPGPPPAKAPPPGKPGKPAKVRGPWSVGTPVAVLAILGFLGVGALYGFVWAGTFDWKIPPWLRTLTGRDAPGEIPDTVRIAEREAIPMILNVEFTLPEIRKPTDAEAKPPIFGTWVLVKDPAAPVAADGTVSVPDRKVYASGNLEGEPSESGVIAIPIRLPPGKYQLEGEVKFGSISRPEPFFEVGPDKPMHVLSFKIQQRRTTLTVNVVPLVKAVISIESGLKKPGPKDLSRGEGVKVFGAPSDGAKLLLGETWTVRITKGEGVKDKEVKVVLDGEPTTTLNIELEKDPGGDVELCLQEIRKNGVPGPTYENNAAVLADPRIIVALAGECVKNKAWERLEDYVFSLKAIDAKSLPADTDALSTYRAWHAHLLALGEEASARGDWARVRELARKTRPEILPTPEAAAARNNWAVLKAKAFLGYPPAAGLPADSELEEVQKLALDDMKCVEDPALKKRVARQILENRAWPAWRAGNELRPPAPGDKGDRGPAATVPGPAVRPWVDLAGKVLDLGTDEALLLSSQRLLARLENLAENPQNVVRLLVGAPEWLPGKTIPQPRIDVLFKKDRLLLARALAQWGDIREGPAAEEAARLREAAWNIYLTCDAVEESPDPERAYPETLAAAALLEGARMAILTKDAGSAVGRIDQYLRIRAGDDWAVSMKRDLQRQSAGLKVPAMLRAEDLVEIPEGTFLVGTSESHPATEEQPFSDPKMGRVPVNVLSPARRVKVYPFLVGIREVTWGQYRKYVETMKDPKVAAMFAHPAEPEEKKEAGARLPGKSGNWSDGEPVRGVDWWDAYACAQYLGGRLATEAEWEKAARWAGHEAPFPDPMPDLKKFFSVEWAKYWEVDNMQVPPGLDFAPSGARGFYGGVSEWTLDAFEPAPSVPKDGIAEGVALYPPDMKGRGEKLLMCARGGSNYHLAPLMDPGESKLEALEKSKEPVVPGVQPPSEPNHVWRGMDLLERRGLRPGTKAKWLGFRIVIADVRSTTTAK